jgi:hypothetical protein
MKASPLKPFASTKAYPLGFQISFPLTFIALSLLWLKSYHCTSGRAMIERGERTGYK